MSKRKVFVIKHYNQTQLAAFYGLSWKTMGKRIKLIPDIGEKTGQLFDPRQVELIVETIGYPTGYYEGNQNQA